MRPTHPSVGEDDRRLVEHPRLPEARVPLDLHEGEGAVERLSGGLSHAREIGETFLEGQALTLWRRALGDGPAASLSTTLATLRFDDSLQAPTAITWMPASRISSPVRISFASPPPNNCGNSDPKCRLTVS